MTRKQIEKLVRVWQRRLGLERWDVKIDWARPLDEAELLAFIEIHDHHDSATIQFAGTFTSWPLDVASVTVVHELLHICHRDVDQAWKAAHADLRPDAAAHAKDRWEAAVEGFVDRLAYRLAELA